MSPSVARKFPTRRHFSRRLVSPSPVASSSRSRDRGSSPVRKRHSGQVKSPKRERSSPPMSRSPSPRTKWLKSVQVEKGADKRSEREHERNVGKGSDKDERNYKERGFEREFPRDRREQKFEGGKAKIEMTLMVNLLDKDTGYLSHHQFIISPESAQFTSAGILLDSS